MCVITINKDKKLKTSDIKKIWSHNPDGAGIVYYDAKGNLLYKKGLMTLNDFLETYHKIPLPHICHFRLASVGGVSPLLTHPFPVYETNQIEGRAKALLVHNGHFSNYEMLYFFLLSRGVNFGEGGVSDSFVLAKALSFLPSHKMKNFIENINNNSKIVVAFNNYKIMKFGNFESKDGIEYSNLYWGYNYYKFNKTTNSIGFNPIKDYIFNYQPEDEPDDKIGAENYIPYKYRQNRIGFDI